MASYLDLDDDESLKTEIDARAPDTFQSLQGRPQLEVNRYFKKKNEEDGEVKCIVKNQDVRDILEIQSLELVWQFIFFNANSFVVTVDIMAIEGRDSLYIERGLTNYRDVGIE